MTILPALIIGLALVGCREKPDPDLCADGSMPATWYLDGDGDGFGGAETVEECEQPEGYVEVDGDCDDNDASYHPDATEDDCTDPNDYNCDGTVEYADGDGDGWAACEDCDDVNSAVYPGAVEICDGLDNNCDALIDDQDPMVTGLIDWYIDYDGDGYGSDRFTSQSCSQPEGYVDNADDCDDAATETYPGADELCDGLDNDCDLEVDEDAVDQTVYYRDTDGDGYGDDAVSMAACETPEGYAELAGDCNTADDRFYPGAPETDCADPNDYNCDGSTGYDDGDGDGFAACEECDDGDAGINPSAEEICDDIDNDCDGLIDDADSGVGGRSTWHLDYDGDTYGSATSTTLACDMPSGYVDNDQDCDDGRSNTYPGAVEVCDDIDNDCDDLVDEDATGSRTWYSDADSDGYGDPLDSQDSCDAPDDYVSNALDCDDDDSTISPAASEVCDDIDNDCDELIDDEDDDTAFGVSDIHYEDADGDSYGSFSSFELACETPDGYVRIGGDCDDTDELVNPTAEEICDGIDNNCVAGIDEASATDATTWYYDADGDGFGTSDMTTVACAEPADYSDLDNDCDDADEDINPDAEEICNDGIDNDCEATFASCTMSLSEADVILTGESSLDDAGVSFAGIGDLDGDGSDDLVIGARNNDAAGTDAGAVYLFNGPLPSGTVAGLGTADLVIVGGSASDRFGRSVAGGTDLDGDGIDDLVVSAPNDSEDGSSSGTTYVFSGADLIGATSLSASDAFVRFNGRTGFDYLGIQVALGDVSGDGQADLLMAATGNDDGVSNGGAIYIYEGPITATGQVRVRDATYTARITGEGASDQVGGSANINGDVDGDGVDDLIVGVTNDSTVGSTAGAAYIVLGPISGSTSLSSADAKLLGDATSAGLGSSTSYLGDQDGDGYDDFAVGATQDDTIGSDAGAVFVLSGSSSPDALGGSSVSSVASAIIYGPSRGHQLGTSVSGIGDFDGDAVNDLLIGAPNGGSPASGFTYLFSGPVTGVLATTEAMASFSGENTSDAAGSPVNFVGDIGGLGTDAIGISALASDRSGTDAGTLYFLFEVGP